MFNRGWYEQENENYEIAEIIAVDINRLCHYGHAVGVVVEVTTIPLQSDKPAELYSNKNQNDLQRTFLTSINDAN